MVFRKGERMLWNPLKRQPLRMRPEERVRLQIIDFLLLQGSMSPSRIAVESPIPSRFSRGRTDLLCYDDAFRPWLLIECKAESVRLGPRAAKQSAVYNRFVKAPYLLLTNGLEDILYHVEAGLKAVGASDYPNTLRPARPWFSTDPSYWAGRGFLPEELSGDAAGPMAQCLALLFHKSGEAQSWLSIPFPGAGKEISHYFLLLPAPDRPDVLIAFTLLALNRREAMLLAVANRKKRNIAWFRCALHSDGPFRDPLCLAVPDRDKTSGEKRDPVDIIHDKKDDMEIAGPCKGQQDHPYPVEITHYGLDDLNTFCFSGHSGRPADRDIDYSAAGNRAAYQLAGILEDILFRPLIKSTTSDNHHL